MTKDLIIFAAGLVSGSVLTWIFKTVILAKLAAIEARVSAVEGALKPKV